MSGLFTRNNLSESGLNAVDALQKLYEPQIQQDILLFAFSSRLESRISSPSLLASNQIRGFINEPLSDSQGNVFLRTKFLTNGFTFSDNNQVWLDTVNFALDKRSPSEIEGSPVVFSQNFSITRANLLFPGQRYFVKDSNGQEVLLPATVQVRLRGVRSGASNCVASLTVNSGGGINRNLSIISGGSGYLDGEFLEPILSCSEGENPISDKCFNYSGNSLYQVPFESGEISSRALLQSSKYTYRVLFADGESFFLYDDRESKWMYLGSEYNSLTLVPVSSPPALVIKRLDLLSSDNMNQLFQLDGRSQFYSYEDSYTSGQSISGNLRNLLDQVEELKDSFRSILQNNRVNTSEFDESNQLGIRFNIVEGKNLISDYRLILRDPDSVLQEPGVTFSALSILNSSTSLKISGKTVPGIWLFSGEKYQRVFSSDEKPFYYEVDRKFYSPALFNPSNGNSLPSSGSFKYSVNASYAPPGETQIRGFDTEINTLIQNISTTAGAGGFVYHRTLVPQTINSSISAWPLFSYKEGSLVKEAKVLAI